MGYAAQCLHCDWNIREDELTPEAIEFAGEGRMGVWQFGEYHRYIFDGFHESQVRFIVNGCPMPGKPHTVVWGPVHSTFGGEELERIGWPWSCN